MPLPVIYHKKYPPFLTKADFEVIHTNQQAIIIGKGEYGTVFLGKIVTTGEMVAIKAFHNYDNLKDAVKTNKALCDIGKSAPKCLGFLLKDMDEEYSSLLNVYSFFLFIVFYCLSHGKPGVLAIQPLLLGKRF